MSNKPSNSQDTSTFPVGLLIVGYGTACLGALLLSMLGVGIIHVDTSGVADLFRQYVTTGTLSASKKGPTHKLPSLDTKGDQKYLADTNVSVGVRVA